MWPPYPPVAQPPERRHGAPMFYVGRRVSSRATMSVDALLADLLPASALECSLPYLPERSLPLCNLISLPRSRLPITATASGMSTTFE